MNIVVTKVSVCLMLWLLLIKPLMSNMLSYSLFAIPHSCFNIFLVLSCYHIILENREHINTLHSVCVLYLILIV